MAELGQILKSKRENLGMTLHEIADKTGIQGDTLRSIENNDFKSVASSKYVKGFIHKYASAVNIDGNRLIEQHRDELPRTKYSAEKALEKFSNDKTVPTYRKNNKDIYQLSALVSSFVIITAVIWVIMALVF
ncbi:helix-turn-helix domain-containing protein [Staphylococcus massiliensis]|uniref:helix-turn-helix domain-containing protein n=1 Tax=Staphylococcus massiliensis TaxID=555791 RepID=UPI001EDF3427|nr:helix-turn-helix domain-containing protein [Staphylococcus massiliensis]